MKNYNITCYADLEREEKRVKGRIRKQEEEILKRVKQLPEEILIAGITKTIQSVINGNFMKSGMSVLKSVGSYFFRSKSEEEEKEDNQKGFKGVVMDLLKGYFNKSNSSE